MPVPAPADKRFRRAHVSPVRRRSWRRSWPALGAIALAGTALGYLLLLGAEVAMSARAFEVTRISVTGNERISTPEVLKLLEGLEGSNVLTADLDMWRKRLLASNWVAQATLRRVFPNGVSVVLSERRAVGIGRTDAANYLIDRTGMFIAEFGPDYADLDLPIVDGLAVSRDGTLMVDEDRAALAGRLLASVEAHPDLAALISQVDVTDARNAVVVLSNDSALLRIGDDRFVERLHSYIEVAPRLREEVPEIEYVDLRYVDLKDDDHVIVGPPRKDRPMRRQLRRGRG